MKKLAIFLAIMLIPFSAFALDTISDNDLDSVTGQAGVSIFTNSIQIVKTGVTTTYTDSNGAGDNAGSSAAAGNFTIVSGQTVQQIFFLGYDPINIDIIDINDAVGVINAAAGANVVTTFYDVNDLGDSGVQITLPNAIVINNIKNTKTYYASDANAINNEANELIKIATNGGTTKISLAVRDFNAVYGTLAGVDSVINAYLGQCDALAWNNLGDDMTTTTPAGTINHADQIKLLITSHE
jgi:hypothetical protein